MPEGYTSGMYTTFDIYQNDRYLFTCPQDEDILEATRNIPRVRIVRVCAGARTEVRRGDFLLNELD